MVVIKVICRIVHLEKTLRAAWDPERYLEGASHIEGEALTDGIPRRHDREDRASVAELTRVIRDRFFWCYLLMCNAVDGDVQDCDKWSSACPCHVHMSTKRGAGRRISQEFGGSGQVHMFVQCRVGGPQRWLQALFFAMCLTSRPGVLLEF